MRIVKENAYTCDACGKTNASPTWYDEKEKHWTERYIRNMQEKVVKDMCWECRYSVVWCDVCKTFHPKGEGVHSIPCEICGKHFDAYIGRGGRQCVHCLQAQMENGKIGIGDPKIEKENNGG